MGVGNIWDPAERDQERFISTEQLHLEKSSLPCPTWNDNQNLNDCGGWGRLRLVKCSGRENVESEGPGPGLKSLTEVRPTVSKGDIKRQAAR